MVYVSVQYMDVVFVSVHDIDVVFVSVHDIDVVFVSVHDIDVVCVSVHDIDVVFVIVQYYGAYLRGIRWCERYHVVVEVLQTQQGEYHLQTSYI